MNYQQAIADAIRQITFRSVAAAVATTADAAVGFGFSCFCAAVAATTDLATSVCQTAVDADATMDAATTADAAAGSGFSCFCAAVAATTAADADAANVLHGRSKRLTAQYKVMHTSRDLPLCGCGWREYNLWGSVSAGPQSLPYGILSSIFSYT